MVKEWGMSEKVGFRTHENESNSLVVVNDLSPQTADVIDSEIKAILQVCDE
jgi:ATP-dependent metalloprotease